MSLQSELLSHIVKLKYEDLPAPVIEATKKSVLDTLAVLIAGSTDEFVPEVVELVKGWAGKAGMYRGHLRGKSAGANGGFGQLHHGKGP